MKTREEIFEDLRQILEEVLDRPLELELKTRLEADLAVDSLKAMEILAAIEDHFDLSIPINVLNEIQTIEDLVIQIEKLLAEG